MPELDEPSTTRLLIALAEAAEEKRDTQSDELDALAWYALDLLKRRWDERHEPIPVGLLGRWLELRALVPKPLRLPGLAATWIEALPSRAAEGPVSDVELSDLREWLTLAELLAEHGTEQLLAFGFPERYYEVGSTVVARIRAGADQIGDLRAAMRALWRLADLLPDLAEFAHSTAVVLDQAQTYARAGEVYRPREIAPELQELLDAPPTFAPSGKQLVDQVLRDL